MIAVEEPKTETSRAFDHLCAILEHYSYDGAKLIPILQAIQKERGFLSEGVLMYVATALDLPPAHVYGVASFYAHFNLSPKGKHIIRLCDGTACHVKGTPKLVTALREHLGLSEEVDTTPDMLFTLETVSCLGACGLAPVMVIDDTVYGQVTVEKAVALVEALVEEEAGS